MDIVRSAGNGWRCSACPFYSDSDFVSEERAAIMEYDGGLTREAALRAARLRR